MSTLLDNIKTFRQLLTVASKRPWSAGNWTIGNDHGVWTWSGIDGKKNDVDALLMAEAVNNLPSLLNHIEQLEEKYAKTLQLLSLLTDMDPCQRDHHGGCQTHGFLSLTHVDICPVAESQALLDSIEEDTETFNDE